MTFIFETHLDYHINALVEAADANQPIIKKLYNNPSDLPLEDLIELRERLSEMEANITLLNNARKVHIEETKKTNRRFTLFKK